MAEPYSQGVPSVAPDATPQQDYQRIDAGPGAFGASQAKDLQQTGQELSQASGNLAQIALLRQERYNQIAVDDSYNKYQDRVQALTYGDPKTPGDVGIYGLRGEKAMYARLPTQEALEKARTEIYGGLRNDSQRLAFDAASRRLQSFTLSAIGRHVDAATEQYGAVVSKAQIANATRDAGSNWNDDNAFSGAYTQALQGVARGLANTGMANNPDAAKAARSAAVDGLIISRAESMAAFDPVRAQTWLKSGKLPDGQNVQDAISAPERLRLQEHIDSLAAQSAGSNAARTQYQRAVGGSPPVAAAELPREGQGFLRALSMGESQGYNAPPPGGDTTPNRFGTRYQFLSSTWAQEAPKAGVDPNDHSPAAQDRVALNYAKNTYATNTGRDLLADVRDGGHEQQIATALNKVWPSLPGGSQQNTDAGTWTQRLKRYAGDTQPTTNDARGPIPGAARRAAYDAILSDPTLDDKARTHAQAQLDHLFAVDDRAAHVDAEGALNEWVPKVRLNPASVDPTQIANDNRLTGEQKDHLLTQLKVEQSGRASGDGPGFMRTYQNIYAPAGTPGRVNSQADLIPRVGNDLTFAGLEKLQKVVKERDTPDGQVRKAALAAMENQIVGTAGSMMPPGPASKAKYADFLGVATAMERELQAKGMPLADIWSSTGPIAKIAPNYVLSPAERMRNLVSPGGGAIDPAPVAPVTAGPRVATAPVQGKWYVPNGSGGFTEAAPGAPNARPYNGGPVFGNPASWALPAPPAAPR